MIRIWLLSLLIGGLGFTAANAAEGAGFKTLSLSDPIGGKKMEAVVFYPTDQATPVTPVGPYRIDAGAGAAPATGRHPLIVLSHGSGGSRFGHHDTAEYLARQGFIVAAIEHPGDNYQDQSGQGAAAVLMGRPIQVSALINALLTDPTFGALIDPDRIGAAGFSAGGYTALLLAGARPDFNLIEPYCARHPDDQNFCDFTPPSPGALAAFGATRDPRIRAVFLMAPLGLFFDKAGVSDVKAPVYLYIAARDTTLIPAENALRIKPWLSDVRGTAEIAGADHYVFLAPCSEVQLSFVPEICTDAEGVDRVAVHRKMNETAAGFFHAALD